MSGEDDMVVQAMALSIASYRKLPSFQKPGIERPILDGIFFNLLAATGFTVREIIDHYDKAFAASDLYMGDL